MKALAGWGETWGLEADGQVRPRAWMTRAPLQWARQVARLWHVSACEGATNPLHGNAIENPQKPFRNP